MVSFFIACSPHSMLPSSICCVFHSNLYYMFCLLRFPRPVSSASILLFTIGFLFVHVFLYALGLGDRCPVICDLDASGIQYSMLFQSCDTAFSLCLFSSFCVLLGAHLLCWMCCICAWFGPTRMECALILGSICFLFCIVCLTSETMTHSLPNSLTHHPANSFPFRHQHIHPHIDNRHHCLLFSRTIPVCSHRFSLPIHSPTHPLNNSPMMQLPS